MTGKEFTAKSQGSTDLLIIIKHFSCHHQPDRARSEAITGELR